MVGFSTAPAAAHRRRWGAWSRSSDSAFGIFRIAQKLLGADITMGYTSLFSAVVIFGGLQLIALSVIGEYIGRIFIQIQGRPLYNVAEEIGFDQASAKRRALERRQPGATRACQGTTDRTTQGAHRRVRLSAARALPRGARARALRRRRRRQSRAIGAAVCDEFREVSTHDVDAIVADGARREGRRHHHLRLRALAHQRRARRRTLGLPFLRRRRPRSIAVRPRT